VGYTLSRAHAQATVFAEARKAFRRGTPLPWIPSAFVQKHVEAHLKLGEACPTCDQPRGYVCIDWKSGATREAHEARKGAVHG
jgi:hypothetical protein